MPGRIVLYGATGYIGGLTAQAMVAAGARPVLAGRDQGRLNALAARLSQAGDGIALETAVAGIESPEPLRRLLEAGDVLVSTAGPFMKVGRPAVAAAVDAGAVYLDSSGEPPFIRQVFEEFGPRAERTGAVLLTAFGYDYVPGNLAGALALQAAGPAATRVRGGLLRAAQAAARDSGGRRRPGAGAARRGGRLPRLVRRRHQARALRFGARRAVAPPASRAPDPGAAGAPDPAQQGGARRAGSYPVGRGRHGGRCQRRNAGRGPPERPGSVLVHRADARLGGGHSGRAGCEAGGGAESG
jgi:hypothetical protein